MTHAQKTDHKPRLSLEERLGVIRLNYASNRILRFITRPFIFSVVITFILGSMFFELIRPFIEDNTFSLVLDFSERFKEMKTVFKAETVILTLTKKHLMIYQGVVWAGLYIIVRSFVNQFLLDWLMAESEPKWYDVKYVPYPYRHDRMELIIGLIHRIHDLGLTTKPKYLKIREKGLYQNIMILGSIGSGKTIALMSQFLVQLIYKFYDEPRRKLFMLVLDVKGNFHRFVSRYAKEVGREKDLVIIEVGGPVRLNVLHKPELTASEIADRMKHVLSMFSSKKDIDYFVDNAKNLITEIIKLVRIINSGYVTMYHINTYGTDYVEFEKLMESVEKRFKLNELTESEAYDFITAKGYWDNTWKPLKQEVKSIINTELSRMTKPFIENKAVMETFCPDRDEINFEGFESAIREGKIVAWKINATKEKALAQLMAAWLKLDCQAEVLNTIEREKTDPVAYKRGKVIFCDEYQDYCTEGDPDYIDKSREAKGIMIVATHSYSSLLLALKNNEPMLRKLTQAFINKIGLRMDDVDYTIKKFVEQIGKVEKEKKTLNINENTRDSKPNWFQQRIMGVGKNISTGVSYSTIKEHLFDEAFFNRSLTEGKGVCLIGDGKVQYEPVVVHAPRQHVEGRIKFDGKRIRFVQFHEDVFGDDDVSLASMDVPLSAPVIYPDSAAAVKDSPFVLNIYGAKEGEAEPPANSTKQPPKPYFVDEPLPPKKRKAILLLDDEPLPPDGKPGEASDKKEPEPTQIVVDFGDRDLF